MKRRFARLPVLITLLCLGAMVSTSSSSGAVLDTTVTTWSRSSQFIITSPIKPSPPPLLQDNPKNNPQLKDVVRLTAAELAISSEQVKSALLVQLETADRWKHRVRLNIRPWLPAHVPVHINSVQFSNYTQVSWLYELEIPEYVERRKLLRALVQVSLLEMGNRQNSGHSVDVPMWLREGLIELLLAREGPGIIAEASTIEQRAGPQFWMVKAGTRDKVWRDPLSIVREKLKITPPLSFSDLSVPVDDQIATVGLEHYQHCSHLFVSELMSLPDASSKLRAFIQNLSRFSHPQFSFFQAFADHFNTPLDVEKWWSLAHVSFLSREDNARWPEKNALSKLNDILQPRVQIRVDNDSLPVKETYTIPQLLAEVDFEQQRPVLRQVVSQLQQLEWNLPPELLKLVYDYHITLASYLHKREQLSASDRSQRLASSTAKPVIRETLKQLTFLEVLRQDFARIGLSETSPPASGPDRVTEFPKSAP